MTLEEILKKYKSGRLSFSKAVDELRDFTFQDLGNVKLDHHRLVRKGFPEVVYGAGKTAEDLVKILQALRSKSKANILATRVDQAKWKKIKQKLPHLQYDHQARAVYIHRNKKIYGKGTILILTAGTSDIPVAQEAYLTATLLGNKVRMIHDVGVAGIQRLTYYKKDLQEASVIIVTAGMEGALPSVVAGLINTLVIAVPTSVGYGASFHGLSALLGMLNSCSNGIVVVNIDNGFGAGYAASLCNRTDTPES